MRWVKRTRASLARVLGFVLLLFFFVLHAVPVALADKFRQHTTIVGLTAKPVAGLPVLRGEGGLEDVFVVNLDLLTGLHIIKFDAHYGNPLYISDQRMFRYT